MARDIKLVWEDYVENYIKSDDGHDEKDEFKNIFDDEEQQFNPKMLTLYPSLGEIIKTPWGPSQKDDKFAYHNFYELRFVHFKGFNSDLFRKNKSGSGDNHPFGKVLDTIDGVAMWKYIDPYCFLIGKARLYSWDEVVKNFDNKIRSELELIDSQKQESSKNPNIVQQAQQAKNQSENITKKGYIAVKFANGKMIETWEGNPHYEVDREAMLAIRDTIGDAEIIIGENV